VDGAQIYARNAAAMWASLTPWSRVVTDSTRPELVVVDIPAQSATRAIVRQPRAAGHEQIGALLARARERGRRIVVEDSFGDLRLPAGDHVTVNHMPVMVKAAAPVAAGPGIRVVHVTSPGTLAQAERVIVDGFPQRALQPFRPGRSLPPLVLTVPGWRTWLAYRDGQPAAAGCSYDDGAATGVYWLATLPEHRGRGLGRAIMSAALSASPGRPAALVATAAGEPLYHSMGFRVVSTAAWYRAVPSG
jgi:GNAT superfamily N-acetyltransferase